MDNVRVLRYDWYTGKPAFGSVGAFLARQYDHLSNLVVLDNAPRLQNYYLVVSMKETEGGSVKTLEPIELSGSFWLIPNIYTQLAQEISFQFCCKTESGDFESHSAEIRGRILPSKDHNGEVIDVEPSIMFDPYKQWVSEIAMAAGAIVIDAELSSTSTNPVQNRIVKAAIDGVDGRVTQHSTAIGDLSRLETDNKTNLVAAINEAAQTGGNGTVQSVSVNGGTPKLPDASGNVNVEVTPADPSIISGAVTDWLDEHPEATTTIPNGSITKSKIATELDATYTNTWVTPQMYGAIGNGVNDDTVAFQSALNSGHDVYIPNGTYAISGVSLANNVTLYFDNALLIPKVSYQDSLISITTQATLRGVLHIDGRNTALNGIKFVGCIGGKADTIKVENCLAWGIFISNSQTMMVDHIITTNCGKTLSLVLSYLENYKASLVGDYDSLTTDLLATDYAKNMYMYDTSGYVATGDPNSLTRLFVSYVPADRLFKASDVSANKIPTAYLNRSCSVFFGGGVLVDANENNEQIIFNSVDSRNNSIGVCYYATYGHRILAMYSQNDGIPVAFSRYSLGMCIDSITAEAATTNYLIVSLYYMHGIIGARSTGYNYNFTSSQIYCIVNSSIATTPRHVKAAISRTLPRYISSANSVDITEQTSDITVVQATRTFNIGLNDTFQSDKTYNPWGIKTIYFAPSSNLTNTVVFKVNAATIAAGYSIIGESADTLTIERPCRYFKADIILSGNTFKVSIQPLDVALSGIKTPIETRLETVEAGYVNQTTLESNYYTKNEIDTMLGDVETLLSGI